MLDWLREGGVGRKRLRDLVRALVAKRAWRQVLNYVHLALGWRGQRRFYLLFAKIFREGEPAEFAGGEWWIAFAGRRLSIPLRPGSAWLDWDSALSFRGNDQDVKRTYAGILASPQRPDIFLDIGANYGSHSLLMLAGGISTISFEPNPACHERLIAWCQANDLAPRLEACALGDQEGTIAFAFPERATWLGHIANEADLAAPDLIRVSVPIRTLDSFSDKIPKGRMLIKLDAEGAEPAILAGGRELIAARRPAIIFECWHDRTARARMWEALPNDYAIHALPWSPALADEPLNQAASAHSPASNFIAVPHDRRLNAQ